jgi:hypothetical protein
MVHRLIGRRPAADACAQTVCARTTPKNAPPPTPSSGPLKFPDNWLRDESVPPGTIITYIGAEAFRHRKPPKDEAEK